MALIIANVIVQGYLSNEKSTKKKYEIDMYTVKHTSIPLQDKMIVEGLDFPLLRAGCECFGKINAAKAFIGITLRQKTGALIKQNC